MDTELKAITQWGHFETLKQNFRETQQRLESLERSNRKLTEKVLALEAHIDAITKEISSKLSAANEDAESAGRVISPK